MSELSDNPRNQQPIEPVEVKLTDPTPSADPKQPTSKSRLLLVLAAGISLTLIMLFVMREPDSLSKENRPSTSSGVIKPSSTPRDSGTQPPAPFESLAKQSANQKARLVISEYMTIEKKLNSEIFIGNTLNEEILRAEELALTGDKLYYTEQYDEALAQYAEATETLRELVSNAETTFDSLLEEALQNLQNQQTNHAASFGQTR